ncbi:hypothetical protein ACWIUD_08240 [Helicobacter sp. 23-1044]
MGFFEFEIRSNEFLKRNTSGFYTMDFKAKAQSRELHFLHILKNNKANYAESQLDECKNKAREHIANFLVAYDKIYGNAENIIVCRVPRSKTFFAESQLYFQKAIREAISLANGGINRKFINGVYYINRIKDVATTHLVNSQPAQIFLPNLCKGDTPYPGITKDSCDISDKVANQTILLIDDIYTLYANVVEDCIQALYDKGAKRVIFYAVGRTEKGRNTPAVWREV